MNDYEHLLWEAVDKLKHYGPQTAIMLSRPFAGESDVAVLEVLLHEAVEEVDQHAKRQGKRRMGARETGADGIKHQSWIYPNPGAGSHYPAVQSFLDRARRLLKPAPSISPAAPVAV